MSTSNSITITNNHYYNATPAPAPAPNRTRHHQHRRRRNKPCKPRSHFGARNKSDNPLKRSRPHRHVPGLPKYRTDCHLGMQCRKIKTCGFVHPHQRVRFWEEDINRAPEYVMAENRGVTEGA